MCLPVRLDNTTNSKLKGTKFVCHVFGLDDQNQKLFKWKLLDEKMISSEALLRSRYDTA